MIASSALLSSPAADCGRRTLGGEINKIQNKYAVSQAGYDESYEEIYRYGLLPMTELSCLAEGVCHLVYNEGDVQKRPLSETLFHIV